MVLKRSRACHFLDFPVPISPHVKALDFSDLSLEDLPDPIKLKHLTELNLGNNLLKELSESIGDLINLTHLYLNNNDLTSLPATFKHLEKLQVLDVRSNKLKRLFENVTDLKCLEILSVEGNPLPVEEVRILIMELMAKNLKLLIDIAGENNIIH